MGNMIIFLLKLYMIFLTIFLLFYIVRHYLFTLNRAFGKQKFYYQDIVDSDYDKVSILIPMYNEEKVAKSILEAVILSDYPKDLLEIIPINDHSDDKTKEILQEYKEKYPDLIKPLHRYGDDLPRGKQHGLNDAMKIATGDIIIVYDADYLPSIGQVKLLSLAFKDPLVGAVMGRVVPYNAGKNLLTRLNDLERAGGYQVDQQARYNLGFIPQYGGTVGGYRKKVVMDLGGFDPNILAEDTDLTFKLYLNGYKVAYANSAECYEQAPESWIVKAKQIKRWSRGHNQVMFKYFFPVLKTKYLNFFEKLDAILLLMIYMQPFLIFVGFFVSIALFFLGEMEILSTVIVLISIFTHNAFGNFAPFFEIGLACFIDGVSERVLLLPFMFFEFVFNIYYTSIGFIEALLDLITKRKVEWEKTRRFKLDNYANR